MTRIPRSRAHRMHYWPYVRGMEHQVSPYADRLRDRALGDHTCMRLDLSQRHLEPGSLAHLFAEIAKNGASVTGLPHGDHHPGRHTIAITLFTTYTDQATENLCRAVAEQLTAALAHDRVTWYGHPITVNVTPPGAF